MNSVSVRHKSNWRRGYLAVLCIAVIGAAALVLNTQSTTIAVHEGKLRFQKLSIDFARNGVQIGILENPRFAPVTGDEHLCVRTWTGYYQVPDIAHLKGLIRIRTSRQALTFVRIRTSWQTVFAMYGPLGVEVTSVDDVSSFPTFGIPDEQGLSGVDSNDIGYQSGYWAILSRPAFKEAGFSSPSVTVGASGYTVVRWIFELDPNVGPEILRVKEEVGTDGSYSRVVLSKGPVPRLRSTTWTIPLQS